MQQANAATKRAQCPPRAPNLLVAWEPWWPGFVRNLRDAFSRQAFLHSSSVPGEFWPDVFVNRAVPWKNLGESAVAHVIGLACLIGATQVWVSNRHASQSDVARTTLTYYSVSEYLPPITQPAPRPKAPRAQKGSPALAKQEIISVPKAPDNSRQTIVNPPHQNVLPPKDIDLPNLVASSVAPQPAVGALPHARLTMPAIKFQPVQPPPDVRQSPQMKMQLPEVAAVEPAPDVRRESLPKMRPLPEASVVQPAPDTQAAKKKIDAAELARLQVEPTLEAPKLPEPEPAKASAAESAAAAQHAAAAAPPPAPVTARESATPAAGQIIALSVEPKAPEKEIKIPDGSRSGIFAASPEGEAGAPGIPEIEEAKEESIAAGDSLTNPRQSSPGISISNAPHTGDRQRTSGIVVAAVPSTPPKGERGTNMLAKASFPRSERTPMPQYGAHDDPKPEDRVFAGRKIYSMQMNMPNLTSAGGSWIIRFAELNEKPGPGDVSTPVATNKVDPAYPPQLMREQVEGTVVLYAIIHADGTVGDVRVLEGFQDQLNENARVALMRWHFRPAMKNGMPVELEAVVQIPFRSRKLGY